MILDIRRFIDINFTWKIHNYKFPKFVQSSRFGKWIDLENLRKERLKVNSSHELDFINDISKLKLPCIPEFPILIQNRELWFELMSVYNVPYKFHNIYHFSLDFFFPFSMGVVVEIDGSQHEKQKEYDMARDDYIWRMYGLKTYRAPEYGKFNSLRSNSFLTFFIIMLGKQLQTFPYQIDFTNDIIDITKDKFNEEFNLVSIIDKKIKSNITTNRELSKMGIYLEKKKILTFNNQFLKPLTGKEIIIVP